MRLHVHYKHAACVLWAHRHCPPDFSALSDGGAFPHQTLEFPKHQDHHDPHQQPLGPLAPQACVNDLSYLDTFPFLWSIRFL